MTDLPTLKPFLQRLLLRSDLSPEEQKAILNLRGKVAAVRTNHDFVAQGEHVDHACLVVSGLVGRFVQNSLGLRQIIAFHIPGDMADLHSVVQPKTSSALQALAAGTVLQIPHRDLKALAAKYPAIAEAFWRDCMVDAAVLSQWTMSVGRRDARAGLAHLICEMAVRCGMHRIGRSKLIFPFPITQFHLADALALTSVHVSRTVALLRAQGLADMRKGHVEILDWDGLVRVGEFDPSYLELNGGPRRISPVRPEASVAV